VKPRRLRVFLPQEPAVPAPDPEWVL